MFDVLVKRQSVKEEVGSKRRSYYLPQLGEDNHERLVASLLLCKTDEK